MRSDHTPLPRLSRQGFLLPSSPCPQETAGSMLSADQRKELLKRQDTRDFGRTSGDWPDALCSVSFYPLQPPRTTGARPRDFGTIGGRSPFLIRARNACSPMTAKTHRCSSPVVPPFRTRFYPAWNGKHFFELAISQP